MFGSTMPMTTDTAMNSSVTAMRTGVLDCMGDGRNFMTDVRREWKA